MSNDAMKESQANPQPTNVRLDDESRVRVMSPLMLVMKRFVRNRLAIIGLVIIVTMFAFAFLGPLFTPYSQTQVFYTNGEMWKDYVSVKVSNELRYVSAEGKEFPQAARAQFILALNEGRSTFSAAGVAYSYTAHGENFYDISTQSTLANVLAVGPRLSYSIAEGATLTPEVQAAFEAAIAGATPQITSVSFEEQGVPYTATRAGKGWAIGSVAPVAIASMRIFDAYDAANTSLVGGYAFRRATEIALATGATAFESAGQAYTLVLEEENTMVYRQGESEPFAIASGLVAQPKSPDVVVTVAFKEAIFEAIEQSMEAFTYAEPEGDVEYTISRTHETYTVKRREITQLINQYATPGKVHPLGTDSNGMDMITRLMYGGRVSLLVGFVVIIIEMAIGVVVGGVAGYFGGWMDTLLMRFIDLFNCIPYYPILIIMGAVMDASDVDPYARIFLLMITLGILGWTGIARVVRGQILSLREQDFMLATEATGVRISRRIFRHLVPNVMPLLIVHATLNLGGIIITEATLSFLGLGLKYPMASWGTIINDATNIYVMTNFWFIWIPAGMLILLTVLGFNFIGDGLRDAFDPKMRR
jgi:peptide/nickel transport system permease protein